MSSNRFLSALSALILTLVTGPAFAFDPDPDWPSPSGAVVSSTVGLPDGKILVSGLFDSIGGVPRLRLARLHSDGSFDEDFELTANSPVEVMVRQADGSVLLGGGFIWIGDVSRQRIARLDPDGTLDDGFNPSVDGGVTAIALQPDGMIIIGGSFTEVDGIQRNRIARLHADGTLDNEFNPDIDNGGVNSVLIQPDGKIIVTGSFTAVNSQFRNRIARLHQDGSIDTGFNPNADASVWTSQLQADGKILVGGSFGSVGGLLRNRIARLDTDGSVDTDFEPGVAGPPSTSRVSRILLQSDGNIVISGRFSALNGQSRRGVARLNPDGSVDPSFGDPMVNVSPSSGVSHLFLQSDGKVLIGGNFTSVGGHARSAIARLHPDGSVDVLALTPAIDFGAWPVGSTSVAQSIFIRHTGSSGLLEVNSVGSPTGPFSAAGGTCGAPPFSLAAGASCALDYTFSPLTEGSAVTAVEVSTEADSVVIELAGEGAAEGIGELQIEPHPLDFGAVPVGEQTDLLATVTNIGTSSVDLTDVLIADPTPWYFIEALAASDCGDQGLTLHPGQSCTLEIVCEPRSLETITRTIQVTSTADNSPTSLQLTCRGWIQDGPPDVGGSAGTSGVLALALQPDGKLVLGGYGITSIGGEPRDNMARVNADDTVDLDFHPVIGSIVNALALQADGKILVATQDSPVVRRLNVDGTNDTSFSLGGVLAPALDLALLEDGSGAWVVGGFSSSGEYAARLDTSGNIVSSIDTNGRVEGVAVQSDGKVVIIGQFTTVAGQFRNYIARLNADGSLDPDYNPNANQRISSVLALPDDKVLVYGAGFIGGVQVSDLARLNPDGSVDESFLFESPPGSFFQPSAMALQSDGKILVTSDYPAGTRVRVVRLHPNGSIDETFDLIETGGTSGNTAVHALALQPDGKIWVGGRFTTITGQPKQRLARLNPDGTLDRGPGIPALQATPDPVDFGAVAVGSQAVMPLTVTNDNLLPGGDGALDLQGLIAPNPPFFVENLGDSDCANQGLSLDPGESCTIDIRCEPDAEGTFTGTLVIESNDLWSPTNVSLACEGVLVDPPEIQVDPAFLYVTVQQGSSIDQAVTVANLGEAPLTWQIVETPLDGKSTALRGEEFWIAQDSGVTTNLLGVSFADAEIGFVVGLNGTILRTENGGQTWISQQSGTSRHLRSVFTVSDNVAFAVGDGGFEVTPTLLRTVDGGQTWIQANYPIPPPNGTTLWSVSFANSSVGTVVGATAGASPVSTILRTEDGGLTWTIQNNPAASTILRGVTLVDSNTGWIVGNAGTVMHTQNGGATWNLQNSGVTGNLFDIDFVDPLVGWSSGVSGTVISTVSGGGAWNVTGDVPTTNALLGISSSDASNSTAVGPFGTILRTVDGGTSWQLEGGGTSNHLRDTSFVNPDIGWAVGDGGVIFHRSGGEPPVQCELPTWIDVGPTSGTINGGDSIQVGVIFDANSLAVASYEANLCLSSNDPENPLVVVPLSLTVTEAQPGLEVDPDILDFGEVHAGASAGPQIVTLSSTGTAPVEVTAIDDATAPFSHTGGNCGNLPFTLAPTESCTLEYTFSPTAEGSFVQAVNVTGNADPVSFDLVGEGVAVFPIANITPASFSFETEQEQADNQTLSISNIGTADLSWTIAQAENDGACDSPVNIPWLETGLQNGTTEPEQATPVGVAVNTDGLAPDDYAATLCVTTNDPDAALVTIPVSLTVTGPEPPVIDVNPESLTVTLEAGDATSETLTIHNLGEADLIWEIEEDGRAGGLRHAAGQSIERLTIGDIAIEGLRADTEAGLVEFPAARTLGDPELITITHSAELGAASAGTVACGEEGTLYTTENQFLRAFHLPDFDIDEGFNVVEVLFAYGLWDGGDQPITVNLYTLDGDFVYANLTLLASETVNLPATVDPTVAWETVAIEAPVPAGATLVMEVAAPNMLDDEQRFVVGVNPFGETAPSYLASNECAGIQDPVTFASIGAANQHLVMAVGGVLGDPVDCTLPEWLDANPTTGTLGEDEEEDINVGFSTASLDPGEHTANLCIGSNDPANPLVVVPVTLNVDEAPPVPGELGVDPAELNFGPVMTGDNGALTFTVANTAGAGAEAIELSAVDLTDGMPGFGITGGTCEAGTTSLAPDESCTVEVTFAPDGEGTFSGEVTVATADAQSAAVALSGTGTALPPAMLSVDPAALDFGELNIGHSATLDLTIGNAAEAPAEVLELNLLEISTGGSVFAITGGDCAVGTELAAGESCMAEITFNSASEGNFNGLMIVGSADGQSMAVSLEGSAIDPGDAIFHDRFEEGAD